MRKTLSVMISTMLLLLCSGCTDSRSEGTDDKNESVAGLSSNTE